MGGAVSSGRDHNDLIDNLKASDYIKTDTVEQVFRAVDRADYMLPCAFDQAYKDMAWKNGLLHLSAPCIYSEVMEGLELQKGQSFLNLGSGTGYLSTMAGLILGIHGTNHGIEIHEPVINYANTKLQEFISTSPAIDEFDFCEPKFILGNALSLPPTMMQYDRVYCGAGCPPEYSNYIQHLIKVGGILVMPLNENLLKIVRVSETEWKSRMLLNVSFATLLKPNGAAPPAPIVECGPAALQALARSCVRRCVRTALYSRHGELARPPARPEPPPQRHLPRKLRLPLRTSSDDEELNRLHDLEPEAGGAEMNALLRLVLDMSRNRSAGTPNFINPSFDTTDTDTDSDSHSHSSDSDTDTDERHSDVDPDTNQRDRETDRKDGDEGMEEVDLNGSDEASTSATQNSETNADAVKSTYKLDDVNHLDRSEDNNKTSDGKSHDVNDMGKAEVEGAAGDAAVEGNSEAPQDAPPVPTRDGPRSRMFIFNILTPYPATGRNGAQPSDRNDTPEAGTSRTVNEDQETANHNGTDGKKEKTEKKFKKTTSKAGSEETQPAADPAHIDSEPSEPMETESENEEKGSKKECKRQKLDSGIGENSPSNSSRNEDSSQSSECSSDDTDETFRRCRFYRRSKAKKRKSVESLSASAEEGRDSEPSKRSKVKRAPPPDPGVVRRDRISRLMQEQVALLPLPAPLRVYVNMGRKFNE